MTDEVKKTLLTPKMIGPFLRDQLEEQKEVIRILGTLRDDQGYCTWCRSTLKTSAKGLMVYKDEDTAEYLPEDGKSTSFAGVIREIPMENGFKVPSPHILCGYCYSRYKEKNLNYWEVAIVYDIEAIKKSNLEILLGAEKLANASESRLDSGGSS